MAADFYWLSYKQIQIQWDATHQFTQNMILLYLSNIQECSFDIFSFVPLNTIRKTKKGRRETWDWSPENNT